jgi:hypothetical protein
MLERMHRFRIGNMKTVDQAAWMGYSLRLSPLFCMKTFSTGLTSCGHRYRSQQNLSVTRPWGERIIHINNKILLQRTTSKIQNGSYG